MTTKEAKKYIGKRVKIRKEGSSLFTWHLINEIYRKHFITDSDTFHFNSIAEIKED